jgi:hypothetical protein
MKQTLEYNIEKDNLLIAKFDGWKIEKLSPFAEELGKDDIFDWIREVRPNTFENNYGGSFDYNFSWSSIMPVWNKIIELETNDLVFDRIEIGKYSIFLNIYLWNKNKEWIIQSFTHTCFKFEEGKETENMLMVYWKTIVDFIKWHNKYNKPKIK